MRYPFLYSVIGQISLEKLSADIRPAGNKIQMYHEWYLKPFTSDYLLEFTALNFHGMQVDDGQFFLSYAKQSMFHVDMREKNYLTHRVLIPLDNHFSYEWFVDNKLHSYKPKPGEVLLFNNIVPHRFVLDEKRNDDRCVVFFNVADPNVSRFYSHFTGDNKQENEMLDTKIKKILGLTES